MSSSESPDTTPSGKRRSREDRARIEFGSVIAMTFSTWIRNFVPFTLLAAVVYLPVTIITLARGEIVTSESDATVFEAVMMLLTSVMSLVLSSTMIHAVFQQLRGERASIAESLSRGMRSILVVLGTAILTGLAAGLMLLPGILLMPLAPPLGFGLMLAGFVFAVMIYLAFFVAVPACVIERLGPIAALYRSRELTRGIKWTILAILIVLGIVVAVGSAIVTFPVAMTMDPFLINIVSLCVQVLLAPISAIPVVIIYHDARRSKEGVDTEEIASVFA